jgi:hypothetical protein
MCPREKIHYIIGLAIFYLIILSVSRDGSMFRKIDQHFSSNSRTEPVLSPRLATNLLLLYDNELSHVETTSFRPTFHNHQLMLKLNLISMATNLSNYFKNNFEQKQHGLNINILQDTNNVNDFHSICHIYLTFDVKILDTNEMRLILLLNNATCSLLLTNTSDIISINIHRTFLVNHRFRFTHQWSHWNRPELIFWSEWPITKKCLNWYLNNLIKNEDQLSKGCPLVSVLTHATAQELYAEEQNAVSYWLDLQYISSIDQTLSKGRDKSMDMRRLAPFEIAIKLDSMFK